VDGAKLVEPLLTRFGSRIVDPPRDTPRCISPKSFPEWFRDDL
jgi:hypothetical protein